MPPAKLIQQNLLDPRPAAQADAAPIADAVNIPLAELPGRTHELPPRSTVIPVVGPRDVADQAVAWLTAARRRAVICTEFQTLMERDPTTLGRLWKPVRVFGRCPHAPAPWGGARSGLWNRTRRDPHGVQRLECDGGRSAAPMPSTEGESWPPATRRLSRRSAGGKLDLERDPPEFDRRFDLITVFRYLHRPLLPRLDRIG